MAYPLLALDVKSYIQSFSDQDQKWNILGHSLGGKVAM
jgi:pimeloyl-ACP methyl ester carboxylesterase